MRAGAGWPARARAQGRVRRKGHSFSLSICRSPFYWRSKMLSRQKLSGRAECAPRVVGGRPVSGEPPRAHARHPPPATRRRRQYTLRPSTTDPLLTTFLLSAY
ncbi:hypothetical protein EVAR_73295_1 [Eumeta japonica]|uniref:Uncharacterized protein n=1 Tax=Eumeta variegata TaxID=151549 RepID=A0A4C1TPA8_EUMVA|nr:hypothetical protein EVAR_73295_1 [Eumeta japonica]